MTRLLTWLFRPRRDPRARALASLPPLKDTWRPLRRCVVVTYPPCKSNTTPHEGRV